MTRTRYNRRAVKLIKVHYLDKIYHQSKSEEYQKSGYSFKK
jgi:hypothetical protein